jgi:hypothetical protein
MLERTTFSDPRSQEQIEIFVDQRSTATREILFLYATSF